MNFKRNLSFKEDFEIPEISQQLPVSKNSVISDDVWDFSDGSLERLNSIHKGCLIIKWEKLYGYVSQQTVIAIKILVALHVNGLIESNLKRKLAKPATLSTIASNLIELFSCVAKCFQRHDPSMKIDIFEIDARCIQMGLDNYQRASTQGIRGYLKIFCYDKFQKELRRSLNTNNRILWTSQDVDKLVLPRPEKINKALRPKELPDELLLFMISVAKNDVHRFLVSIEENPVDTIKSESLVPVFAGVNFKECFSDYAGIRLNDSSQAVRKGKRNNYSKVQREAFKNKYGITSRDVYAYIQRVQMAARYLILQFTGARYSEAISFKTGAISVTGGEFYIKGTVIKNKSTRLPTGNDYWVAIPIVRDAVSCLELIANFTLHKFLFASGHSQVLGVRPIPMGSERMNDMLNQYLFLVDIKGEFTDRQRKIVNHDFELSVKPACRLTTHRIRHTLAYQFCRHRSGLLVAAYHFKHAYIATKLYKIPNDVTEGYGSFGNEVFNDAKRQESLRSEIIHSICSPDAPIAGGGAERFLKNRDAFFSGEIKKGKSVEQILKDLSKRHLPLADVMLGYCGGKNNFTDNEGIEQSPPCIGQLKCNPSRCPNAIITKLQEPHWRNYKTRNQELLNDPRMSHARQFLESHIEEADRVLNILSNGNS